MTLDSIAASKSPTKSPDGCHRKFQSLDDPAASLAITAGIVLALASAATNAIYGWQRSETLPSQITWSAVSVAASIILALAPTAFLKAVKARSIAGAVVAVIALALCGTYSFSAAIGASSGQRMTAESTSTEDARARTRFQTAYDGAQAELETLALTRPAAELEALITQIKATPGANGCVGTPDGPISRKACAEAATVAIELGRAQRRAELETKTAEASRGLEELGRPKIANSDAVAIVDYLAVAGIHVTVEELNRWLALLAVALLDFGGGLAFAVAAVLREPSLNMPVEHNAQPERTVPKITVVDTVDELNEIEARQGVQQVSTTKVRKLVVPEDFGGRLISLLNDRGGEVYSGHRALGAALGCSPSHVGNVLRELSDAGRVIVKATKTGTVVKLAA